MERVFMAPIMISIISFWFQGHAIQFDIKPGVIISFTLEEIPEVDLFLSMFCA